MKSEINKSGLNADDINTLDKSAAFGEGNMSHRLIKKKNYRENIDGGFFWRFCGSTAPKAKRSFGG